MSDSIRGVAGALRDHIVHARHDQALVAANELVVSLSEDSSTGPSGTLSGITTAPESSDSEFRRIVAQWAAENTDHAIYDTIAAAFQQFEAIVVATAASRDAWKAYAEHRDRCEDCVTYLEPLADDEEPTKEEAEAAGYQSLLDGEMDEYRYFRYSQALCEEGQQRRDAAVAS